MSHQVKLLRYAHRTKIVKGDDLTASEYFSSTHEKSKPRIEYTPQTTEQTNTEEESKFVDDDQKEAFEYSFVGN